MSAEAGAGDWSGHHGVRLRLLSLGSGHLWWLSAEQWLR